MGCNAPDPGPAVSLAEKAGTAAEEARGATHGFELFRLESALLAEFGGEKSTIEATVLLPPGHDPTKRYPVNYYVHGFGGSHGQAAAQHGSAYGAMMVQGESEHMIHVFLDANHPMGHHVFADSKNTGPWGTALVEEFIPAVEKKFGGAGVHWGRFVTGHSSGGWSSLWLQIMHPDVFGGVWSTAPDPVDFRDFTGINLYASETMYRDGNGDPYFLMRKNGGFVSTFEQYVHKEDEVQPRGGQIYSFDAVFGPRRTPRDPVFVFDHATGKIDREVLEHWKPYDISLRLRTHWEELGPKLAGKLNIFVGTQDTFRLEGAVALLDRELEKLGSDATIVFVEGRTHFDLSEPDPQHYPKGLKKRVAEEMWKTWVEGEARTNP
jgi:poly(3-hydroxybutyrate) depolymerase